MKRIVFIINILIITCINLVSYAGEENNTIGINTNKEQIKKGEEIEISIKIPSTENPIYTYSGELEYDKEAFEKVTSAKFNTENSWENLEYNEQNGKFILTNNASNGNEEILKIKLLCKSDEENTNTKINVKNLKTVNEEQNVEIIALNSKQIDINIRNSKEQNNDNEQKNDTENTSKNNENSNKEEQKDNILNGILPFTGKQSSQILILLITITAIISICLLIRYKKINKTLLVLLLTFAIANNIYTNVIQAVSNNTQKGDINLDGKIDKDDIQLLEKHLIDIEEISKDKQENADIYEDNTINLVDLHYLIKNINNKTDDDNTPQYNFEQITPVDSKVTYEPVLMANQKMKE